MKDGIYRINFRAAQGYGMGMLLFENGKVFGSDTEGAKYDGDYIYNAAEHIADVTLKVLIPPNVKSVFGITNPYEWGFEVSTKMDMSKSKGDMNARTSFGKEVMAEYVYLRSLPDAA